MITRLHPSVLLVLTVFLFQACSSLQHAEKQTAQAPCKPDKQTMALEAAQWEFFKTHDPATNTIPSERLHAAMMDIEQKYRNQPEAAISGVTWTERGPNNLGGRTRALMYDPNDATKKTVWAGGVAGGLWKTTDITATTPVWTPINDFFANLAVTCIAYDSLNTNVMYFGTGEGWSNSDATGGAGVWKSTDGGATWSQLASTNNITFRYCQDIEIDLSGNVYVATRSGLQKSTNGGATWSVITTGGLAANTHIAELVRVGNRLHVANGYIWQTGGYQYTNDGGATWGTTNFGSVFATCNRVAIAAKQDTIYALTGNGQVAGEIGVSYNGGANWTLKTKPTNWSDNGTIKTDFTRNQAWYDLVIAIDPNNADTVYIGGVDLMKSTNGAGSWTQISSWTGNGFSYVHADQHAIIFKPGSSTEIVVGNDGGVHRTTNAGSTFTERNNGYNVTQFYAADSKNEAYSNFFLAGAQDNGTQKFQSLGINSTTSATGGDGAFCHIDANNSNNMITSYVYNNFYRSTNGGASFPSSFGAGSIGPFICPTDLDDVNNILYASGGDDNIRRYSDVFGTVSSISLTDVPSTPSQTITAITVSPNNPTTVYFAGNQRIYRLTDANQPSGTRVYTNITGALTLPGSVSSIDVRKAATDDTIIVTISNYGVNNVYYTYNATNATPTWVSADNGLPDVPMRWAIFSPESGRQAYLATDVGVYSTDLLNGTSTSWGLTTVGKANVRVDMLKIRWADSLIMAATHGRGLYTTDKHSAAKAIFSNPSLAYIGQPVQFTDGSVKPTSWAWDFDNNGSIDATTQNPIWAYGTAGVKTISLTINGVKTTTGTILVLPNRNTPYTTAQGGDFESNQNDFGAYTLSGTAWERGNSVTAGKSGTQSGSNAWVTGLSGNYVDNSTAYLYTPNFNLTTAGTYAIKFYLKNAFEISWDGMNVEYSTDKGTNWTVLGTVAANWYDRSTASITAFPANVPYFNSNRTSFAQQTRDISFLAGNASVAFRFVFKSDENTVAAGCAIDNFEITLASGSNAALSAEVETAVSSKAEIFGPSATVDFYSPNGKIMATLTNLSTHNYGLTTVSIDNSGTSAINYSTNTAASQRLHSKTYTVSPSNNNGSGSYKAKLYYTSAENTGWVTITGGTFAGCNIIKCPVNIASGTLVNGVQGTTPTTATYNLSDKSIEASFTTGFSGFGVGTNNVVLPVELMSFTAEANGKDALLKWTTASEKNNKGFFIQRSTDGKSWTDIDFVAGKGNSFSLSKYSYTDVNALKEEAVKTIFYRLRQVDFNESFDYSEVRLLNLTRTQSLSLNPNPFNEFIEVSGINEKSEYTFWVLDIQGKQVLTGSLIAGQSKVRTDMLPAGIYFIRLSNTLNGYSEVVKMVK